MKYFPLVALILSAGLAGVGAWFKDKELMTFAGGMATLAGTSYQGETKKSTSDHPNDTE